MPQPIFSPQDLQELTFFAGYIDPNLGYAFQSLGPIIPAIIGIITGTIAMFWVQIKSFFHSLKTKKGNKDTVKEEK